MAQEEQEEWETEEEDEWETEVSMEADILWGSIPETDVSCMRIDLEGCFFPFRFSAEDIAFWKEKYLEQIDPVPIESVRLKVSSFQESSFAYYHLMDFLRTTQTRNLELVGANNDILFALRRLRCLEKIIFSDCYSSDETEVLGGLAAIFTTNTGIKEFSAPFWGGEDTKAQFLQSIQHLRALEHIEITYCDFSGIHLLTLKQSLEISGAASKLKTLRLEAKEKTKFSAASELLQVLTPLTSLEELDLTNLSLEGTDPDSDAYQRFVRSDKSRLLKLILVDVGITGEMLLPIISGTDAPLKHLYLCDEKICGPWFPSTQELSSQLTRRLSTIESVELRVLDNHFPHITSMLSYTGSSLEEFCTDSAFADEDPESNEFQDFIQSLRSNEILRKLDLHMCGMKGKMLVPFFKSLNQNLSRLSIQTIMLLTRDVEESPELHEVLWSNKSLTHLSIKTEHCECDFPEAVALRNRLVAKTAAHASQVNSENWPMLVGHHFGQMWGKRGISSALLVFLVECAHMIPYKPRIYEGASDAASAKANKKVRRLQEDKRE